MTDDWEPPEPDMDAEFTYQWNADWDEDKPILKITKSSLGTFKWCNKQYEFSYLDKRPQDSSLAMLKGSAVHNSHERFYNEVDMEGIEDLSKAEIADRFRMQFPVDDYGQTYDGIIAYEADRCYDSPELFLPAGNEAVLWAKWEVNQLINVKFILNRNYTVQLNGHIDRIFLENGGYILMELKTGLWKDAKTSGMRQEMAFYKLLMENASDENLIESGLDPNIPITHWGWFYPDSNYHYVEECKPASQTALKKSFAKLIKSYENENFPASYFYKKCVHCSYMGICDAAMENQLVDW